MPTANTTRSDFLPMLAQIDAGAAVVYGTRLSPEAARLNHEVRDKFYYARRLLPWLTNALFGTAAHRRGDLLQDVPPRRC